MGTLWKGWEAEVISCFTVTTGVSQGLNNENNATTVYQVNIGMLIELLYFVAQTGHTLLRCFLPSVSRISLKYSMPLGFYWNFIAQKLLSPSFYDPPLTPSLASKMQKDVGAQICLI